MRELGAGADAELPIDPRQRRLDGVLGEEEGGRDFPVRLPLGDELARSVARPPSARRARARPPMRASSARVCSAHSGAPSRSKRAERVLEGRPGGAALLRPPLRSPEREQRPRVVERIRAAARARRARARSSRTRRRDHPARRAAARGSGPGSPAPRPGRARRRVAPRWRGPRPPRRARRRRSAPRAGRPARGAAPGSSMKSLRSSYERRRYSSAAAASPSESSTKPSTQPWPDCAMRIPSASARAIARCALARASSIRPRCAAMIAAGNSSGGRRRGRAAIEEVQRVGGVPRRPPPSSLPATREAQEPERIRLAVGVVPCPAQRAAPPGRAPARGRRPPTTRADDRRPTSDRRRAATRPAIARARAPLPSPRSGSRVPR